MTRPEVSLPSGQQHLISSGDQSATIVEVGGGVRCYTVGDRDVLQPYNRAAMCDGAHGAPLIPWPNRLADGHYTFDGTDHQVPLNEPEKQNAIHGFLRWRSWQASEHTPDRVVMSTQLNPLQGYPYCVQVQVAYTLSEEGLSVVTTATNAGAAACPYGHGQHPYLSPGSGTVNECTLALRAGTRVTTDPQRQLPTGTVPVAGSEYDFSTPRRIGDLEMDHAFTDLGRDEDGRAWVHLTGTDGAVAQLWVDETYPIVEIYTADTLQPPRRRRGLGTEPMTCPPNAFASGDGVIRLEPGQSHTTTWGARLSQPQR